MEGTASLSLVKFAVLPASGRKRERRKDIALIAQVFTLAQKSEERVEISPLSGEFALLVSGIFSNDLSSRKSLMVDEVEMTEALPSLADDGSGGACVEAARFGSSIGNGDGHGEGVTGDRLSSLKCTPWLRAESRDLVVSK